MNEEDRWVDIESDASRAAILKEAATHMEALRARVAAREAAVARLTEDNLELDRQIAILDEMKAAREGKA